MGAPHAPGHSSVCRRLAEIGICVSLFMVVLGANWSIAERFGSDMPDWDQWDAEATNMLLPWFRHDHFIAHLFKPHNEHRVVLTKLQNLAVTLAAGQWDQRLECLFNAILHAGIAIELWLLGRRCLARRLQLPYLAVVAALYALPLSWQNLIGGFHSQQYWLIGLSFAAIFLLPFARAGSGAWWTGIGCAVLALGSMTTGFIAAAGVAAAVAIRLLAGEVRFRSTLPTLLAMTVLVVAGDATRVEVNYHAGLKAGTIHDFVLFLLRSLEWPVFGHRSASLLTWAPWMAVAAGLAWNLRRGRDGTRRNPIPRAQLTIVILGGWVLVQLLATAYGRGAGAPYPASRYMDTLMFGTAINALALGWWLSRGPRCRGQSARRTSPGRSEYAGPRPGSDPSSAAAESADLHFVLRTAWGRVLQAGIAVAWVCVVAGGLRSLAKSNLEDALPPVRAYYRDGESHVLAYLATHDPAQLAHPIPYPSSDALAERLSHPELRRLMPVSVRPSLPIVAAHGSGGLGNRTGTSAFLRNLAVQLRLNSAPRAGLSPATPPLGSRVTWGSYNRAGLAGTGAWQSEPLVAPMKGWLVFQTAGDINSPAMSLEIRNASGGHLLGAVHPSKDPGASWRSAYVRAPRRPFVIVATDKDPNGWFAFSAPAEMSSASYWAWRLMKNGMLISEIALAAIAMFAIAAQVIE